MWREHLAAGRHLFRLAVWPVMKRHRIITLADKCRTMARATVCAETRETLYSIAADLDELAVRLAGPTRVGPDSGAQIIRLRQD